MIYTINVGLNSNLLGLETVLNVDGITNLSFGASNQWYLNETGNAHKHVK